MDKLTRIFEQHATVTRARLAEASGLDVEALNEAADHLDLGARLTRTEAKEVIAILLKDFEPAATEDEDEDEDEG